MSANKLLEQKRIIRNLQEKARAGKDWIKVSGKIRYIILAIIGILAIVAVIVIGILVKRKMERDALMYKCIVRGSKNAKNSLVIKQRDSQGTADQRILRTLNNMNKGLAFTYSVWININSMDYNKGKLKPVFYKSTAQDLTTM